MIPMCLPTDDTHPTSLLADDALPVCLPADDIDASSAFHRNCSCETVVPLTQWVVCTWFGTKFLLAQFNYNYKSFMANMAPTRSHMRFACLVL
jgi:hypothetical protein